MYDDLILDDSGTDELVLDDGSQGDSGLDDSVPYYKQGTDDYEELKHKPTINGRTVIGDQTMAYYLQDGLIIDGGDSTGVM